MNNRTMGSRGAFAALIAITVFVLAACGNSVAPASNPSFTSSTATTISTPASPSSGVPASTMSPSGMMSPSSMMSSSAGISSMQGMPMPSAPGGPHNQADVTFAQQMLVHHRGAIAMAELAPTRASSGTVKDLAVQIKAAQDPEITQMTNWLSAWAPATDMNGKPITTAPGSSGTSGMAATSGMAGMGAGTGSAMPGMMSDQQTGQLTAATGAAFDKMFLQLMIAHHQGALTMARAEKTQGSNPAALALANSIITSQTAEITTMQNMLQSR